MTAASGRRWAVSTRTGGCAAPRPGPLTDPRCVVNRVERACAEAVRVGDTTFTVGTSVGVTVSHRGCGVTADELIAEANRRMYRHKQMPGAALPWAGPDH